MKPIIDAEQRSGGAILVRFEGGAVRTVVGSGAELISFTSNTVTVRQGSRKVLYTLTEGGASVRTL